MFGIKFNNKLQMSKVKKPSRDEELMNKFDKAPKGFRQPPKPYDVKGYKSLSEKAAEAKQKALDEETV